MKVPEYTQRKVNSISEYTQRRVNRKYEGIFNEPSIKKDDAYSDYETDEIIRCVLALRREDLKCKECLNTNYCDKIFGKLLDLEMFYREEYEIELKETLGNMRW